MQAAGRQRRGSAKLISHVCTGPFCAGVIISEVPGQHDLGSVGSIVRYNSDGSAGYTDSPWSD